MQKLVKKCISQAAKFMFWTVHSMACSLDEPVPFTRQHLVEWTGPGPCTLLDKISSEWDRGQFYQQTIRIWACQQYIIPTTSQNQYIPKPIFLLLIFDNPLILPKIKCCWTSRLSWTGLCHLRYLSSEWVRAYTRRLVAFTWEPRQAAGPIPYAWQALLSEWVASSEWFRIYPTPPPRNVSSARR